MWQSGTQSQHTHQPGQGGAGVFRCPGNHQFHTQGVDSGQTQAGSEPEQAVQRKHPGPRYKAGVRQCAQQARNKEDAAGAEAIRQAGHRQSKRTGNKTRLNRERKPAQIRFR